MLAVGALVVAVMVLVLCLGMLRSMPGILIVCPECQVVYKLRSKHECGTGHP